jgi:hypothetical protein
MTVSAIWRDAGRFVSSPIELLLSLPTWVGCCISMVSTTFVGLVVYLVFYKFISKYQSYDLKDPNTSLFRVVGKRTEALKKQLNLVETLQSEIR